ncbi:ATP-binding protein [Streptomyces sp. NPDC050439]|uniref:ATP-binding protein n=1 Tax=unclassified Streptomyces TaxID=2593676 RepID=UPI00343DBC9E
MHVMVCDTSPISPRPRAPGPDGSGGLGWALINTLAQQVSVITGKYGKEINAFMPW